MEMPLVPVVQLWRRDVPDMPWPHGADLFQVLWCPASGHPEFGPVAQVVWRDSSTGGPPRIIGGALSDADLDALIDDEAVDYDYVFPPCRVSPEAILDYPSGWDLTDQDKPVVRQWQLTTDLRYDFHLGAAPGVKVGGWPDWVQDAEWPTCPAGHGMEPLITLASWEADSESYRTWLPREEVDAVAARRPDGTIWAITPSRTWPGFMIGDAGSMFGFICTTCPDRPVAWRIQFS
jgi:hypothetical protein